MTTQKRSVFGATERLDKGESVKKRSLKLGVGITTIKKMEENQNGSRSKCTDR